MPVDLSEPHPQRTHATWALGVLGILATGAIDFATGVELRVFPLYYLPLAVLAWGFGRRGALIGTVLCGMSWAAFNFLAGLEYSITATWAFNTGMQMASFATVGLLIAVVRESLTRERELARSDPLTKMLNRKGFYEEAARLIALCRRSGRPLTMAYIDLDNFKNVNDQLGHEQGDVVIRTAAQQLRAATRPSDVAARLGGDEFIVLFPELDGSGAELALERIRASLAETLPSEPVPVSASIGAVTFASPPADIEDMLRASDAQMYAAKAAGRNRVELHVFASRRNDNHPER